MGKIRGQQLEQYRETAIPMERIVGLWVNAIWREMNEAENELKRCRNGTMCNGVISESNEGRKNELLLPLPMGFIDVILRTK